MSIPLATLQSRVWVVLCVGSLLFACTHPRGDWPVEGRREITTEVVRSPSVPSGWIEGIVVNAQTGEPIRGTLVHWLGTSNGTNADSLGRFRLPPTARARNALAVEMLGYEAFKVTLDPRSANGYAARIALLPVRVEICMDYVDPQPAVTVVVKDARTGRAPVGQVTLRIRQGPFRDSAFVNSTQQPERIVLSAGSAGTGTYDVSVSAPGYTSWLKQGVETVGGRCRSAAPRGFMVLLLPAGQRVYD